MKKDILKYLNNIVEEISETVIPQIKFNEEYGYENFFHSGCESYAKRLGRELIQANIHFESLFDIGYGKFDENENSEFAIQYTEACKKTPNHIFLQNILPIETQKDILLKSIQKFDFNNCLETLTKNSTKINSVFHILKDFRSIGVDKSLINDEITAIVKYYFAHTQYPHPNIIISFINEGFFFDENFMKNQLHISFKYTFGHLGKNCDEKFEVVYCNNTENKIKFNYNEVNNSLPFKEEHKIKINKI